MNQQIWTFNCFWNWAAELPVPTVEVIYCVSFRPLNVWLLIKSWVKHQFFVVSWAILNDTPCRAAHWMKLVSMQHFGCNVSWTRSPHWCHERWQLNTESSSCQPGWLHTCGTKCLGMLLKSVFGWQTQAFYATSFWILLRTFCTPIRRFGA